MKLKLFSLFILISVAMINISYAQAEINVVGNIQNIVDGDISPSLADRTDFDFAIIGGGKVVHTFTIQNVGNSPLTLMSIAGTTHFENIGLFSPGTIIAAGASTNFTVTFQPSVMGALTGTITINSSDADEAVYDFAVAGTGVLSAIGAWDPVMYPPAPCSWSGQDNNTTHSPYASWSLAVAAAEAAGTNAIIALAPSAYIGSYDYDNQFGNESCLGHSVSSTMDLTAAQNGMQILGSSGGCMTFIDLNSGTASDQWANFTGMNGLTIKNIYLRGWGGAISMVNCSNVLIEDCVFEDINNLVVNGVMLSGCTNVTFRRCKFLGNDNTAGRALNITNSGTAANRILLEDCDFGCNINGGSGAALMVGAGSFIQVNGGNFSGNNSGAGGRGGAVNVAPGGDIRFTNTRFMLNNSPGINSSVDGGGAIFVDGSSNVTQTTVVIDGCNFYQNKASGSARGGAIVCQGNSTNVNKSFTTIQNSRFEMNGADRGGAILALNCKVLINNNVFTNNQSAAFTNTANAAGGAISFQNTAGNYTITNNHFVGNLSASSTRAINDAATGSAFTLTGNFLDAAAPAQTENLSINNTGATTGSSISLTSIAAISANYNCSTGAYCAVTVSGTCLSDSRSNFICSPSPAASGSITGQVWNDVDGDGLQETGDNGIANALVLLYDENGYLVGTTQANANGDYTFTGIPVGSYRIAFVNPSLLNYTYMSPANAPGSTENSDSDQNSQISENGELRAALSGVFVVGAGSTMLNVDAGFTNINTALPLDLLDFRAKMVDKSILLQWFTANEINNSYFNIEKSLDGVVWKTIGTENSQGAAAHSYIFPDNEPEQGLNYYRLVQVDIDGTASISSTINVMYELASTILFYPNPSEDFLYIQSQDMQEEIESIRLTDMTGRPMEVGFESLPKGQVQLDLRNLSPGNYTLVYKSNKQTIRHKIVKY